jgi:predicted dehydrogenase
MTTTTARQEGPGTIEPFVIGSGMSGKGMAKALAIVEIIDPELRLAPLKRIQRNQSLRGLPTPGTKPLLLIGNPHGCHAQTLLDGIEAGFEHFVLDKPVCTSLEDVARLKQVRHDVAVCHGFRQQWGPQTLRRMIDAGEFGELISVEGRYWQSSAAQAALAGGTGGAKDWKNDRALNGPYDALVDLGAHYTDLLFFLADSAPTRSRAWVSHVNAPAPHRDTHAHVEFDFPRFRARGSISKTAHGAGNDLELTVLGQKQSVTWHVERPDELRVAQGSAIRILQKPADRSGSQQPPFHGTGWLEGYIEIIHRYLRKVSGDSTATYPTLQESLRVMETLLSLEPESR